MKLHKKSDVHHTLWMVPYVYGAMLYSVWLLCVCFWNFKLAKIRIHQCFTLVFSVHWNSMKVDTIEKFHWWIVVWRQLYSFREQYFKMINILNKGWSACMEILNTTGKQEYIVKKGLPGCRNISKIHLSERDVTNYTGRIKFKLVRMMDVNKCFVLAECYATCSYMPTCRNSQWVTVWYEWLLMTRC